MYRYELSLPKILCRSIEGGTLRMEEIQFLLNLRNKDDIELLHRTARLVRSKYFGQKVFLYGLIYFSTQCRSEYNLYDYRRSNMNVPRYRYRNKETEILTAAMNLHDSGVHLINLAMEEQPTICHQEFGMKRLVRMVEKVRTATGLPVMVSLEAINSLALAELVDRGGEWVSLCQQTHCRELFADLRPGQCYDSRTNMKSPAKEAGMLTEEGILIGAGEKTDDIARSILTMKAMGADQVRAMTFVPQEDFPQSKIVPERNELEEIVISIMRLVMPDALIPVSLDMDGLNGLQKRLLAGANVITSIVPTGKEWNGLANSRMDIDDTKQSLMHIQNTLQFLGMQAATSAEYREWVDSRKAGGDSPFRRGGKTVNCRYWC